MLGMTDFFINQVSVRLHDFFTYSRRYTARRQNKSETYDLTYNIDYNSVVLHILSMVIFYFLLYIFYIRMFEYGNHPFLLYFLSFIAIVLQFYQFQSSVMAKCLGCVPHSFRMVLYSSSFTLFYSRFVVPFKTFK